MSINHQEKEQYTDLQGRSDHATESDQIFLLFGQEKKRLDWLSICWENGKFSPQEEKIIKGMRQFVMARKSKKIQNIYASLPGVKNPSLGDIYELLQLTEQQRRKRAEELIQKIIGNKTYDISIDWNFIQAVHLYGKGVFLDTNKKNLEKFELIEKYFERKEGKFSGKGAYIARVLMDYGICGKEFWKKLWERMTFLIWPDRPDPQTTEKVSPSHFFTQEQLDKHKADIEKTRDFILKCLEISVYMAHMNIDNYSNIDEEDKETLKKKTEYVAGQLIGFTGALELAEELLSRHRKGKDKRQSYMLNSTQLNNLIRSYMDHYEKNLYGKIVWIAGMTRDVGLLKLIELIE